MPPTRVGHKKSRFGCIRCKQRHVKCDEQRPCGNCARHQVPCSLVLATLSPDDAAQPPPAPTPTDAARSSNCSPFHASRSASDASQSPSTLPLPQRPSHGPSPQHLGPLSATSSSQALSIRAKVSTIREALLELTDDVERLERSHSQTPSSQRQDAVDNGPPHAEGSMSTNEWLGDLSLLYHYLATDGLCLSHENRQGELWQNIVPELAFTRDSLMHGLLALSALHLAYMHPEKKRQYATQSARHQEIALSRLRNGLFDINEENCHEYFILTFMILVLTFCSISNPFDDMHRIDTHQLGQSLFLGQGKPLPRPPPPRPPSNAPRPPQAS
ncbi:hypothetical protein GTA08_BOTSDO00362 [Neofusicoccum parvum]|nr:hypothetical protein GTA08_BOTSDO00362 [Neofusicoccum parvum]